MSGVESDVIPFGRVKGERASLAGLNLVGLERGGFDKDTVRSLQKAMKELFEGSGTMDERIEQLATQYTGNDVVMAMVEFARNKERFGLCQPDQKKAA
jgi:UDP-N-acetylglucosamine acyltransferase